MKTLLNILAVFFFICAIVFISYPPVGTLLGLFSIILMIVSLSLRPEKPALT